MPKPSTHIENVAQMLVDSLGRAEGTGASRSDIAAGYRIAADRVAAWVDHRDWRRLQDGR